MGRKEALEKSEGTWENERDVGTDDDDQQERPRLRRLRVRLALTLPTASLRGGLPAAALYQTQVQRAGHMILSASLALHQRLKFCSGLQPTGRLRRHEHASCMRWTKALPSTWPRWHQQDIYDITDSAGDGPYPMPPLRRSPGRPTWYTGVSTACTDIGRYLRSRACLAEPGFIQHRMSSLPAPSPTIHSQLMTTTTRGYSE